jgi:hypothetical protein
VGDIVSPVDVRAVLVPLGKLSRPPVEQDGEQLLSGLVEEGPGPPVSDERKDYVAVVRGDKLHEVTHLHLAVDLGLDDRQLEALLVPEPLCLEDVSSASTGTPATSATSEICGSGAAGRRPSSRMRA